MEEITGQLRESSDNERDIRKLYGTHDGSDNENFMLLVWFRSEKDEEIEIYYSQSQKEFVAYIRKNVFLEMKPVD